ncbi:MAG: ABC transporter permease [Spirochaetaceae bacterium]|nr:MAG: ABC transporter permease [Spirochaetaceae bacterium]
MEIWSVVFWNGVATAAVRMSIPILLAGLGIVFSERSGVLNIGVEGQMLSGAFGAFAFAYFTGSFFLGAAFGALVGMIVSGITVYMCVRRPVNQIVVGVTVNILCLGLTSFINRIIFTPGATPPRVPRPPVFAIPGLDSIPIIGAAFFRQPVPVYVMLLAIPLAYLVLYRSSFGLDLRAAGEHPKAAETMGVKVATMRTRGVLISGAFAGLAGAFLSIVSLGRFVENISSGRGFIALAIVIFGRWNPVFIFGAALIFGTAEALQLRLQAVGVGVPHEFLLMMPYVLTIIVLALTSKRSLAPAALGRHYQRE